MNYESTVKGATQFHSLFLDVDGNAWGCGYNEFGQLGLGHTGSRNVPQKIKNMPKIQCISMGGLHSLFLDATGSVWSCGYNEYGQLGLSHVVERNRPQKIKTLISRVDAICAGYVHSLFLDEEGSVWACGYNDCGQLGTGDDQGRLIPTKINNIPKIKSICAGQYHSLLLDYEGHVWTCGGNQFGQLGMGDTLNRTAPAKIPQLPTIKYIATGCTHSFFIDMEGHIWACGNNNAGQLGLGDVRHRFKPEMLKYQPTFTIVSCGRSHSILVDSEGFVWVTGSNKYGQLGTGDTLGRASPVKTIFHNQKQQSIYFCGANHTVYIDTEGNMFTTGKNKHGQLGLGDTTDRHSRERIKTIPLISTENRVKKVKESAETEIQQIFEQLQSEQSPELIEKIRSCSLESKINENKFIKEHLLKGEIPLCDWNTKWDPIRTRFLETGAAINDAKGNLAVHQEQLAQLQGKIKQLEEQIVDLEDQHRSLDFFNGFFQPIVAVEKELTESFRSKLGKISEFSVDDVCLFLNFASLSELVDLFQEKQVDGELLVLLASVGGFSGIGIEDTLLEKQLEFHWKLLENNLLFDREKLEQSVVWRHRSPENTLKLLNEFDLTALDPEIVTKKQISICQLIYFSVDNFVKTFGITLKAAVSAVKTLQDLRLGFENFVQLIGTSVQTE